MAKLYADACNALAATSSGIPGAFAGSEPFGGAGTLRLWTQLHDGVQGLLGDTATNLELTGQALCAAADEYARVDTEAGAEFRRLMHDNGSPLEVSVPQPIRPEPAAPVVPTGSFRGF